MPTYTELASMEATTVNELIERLEKYCEGVGGDDEVRLMTQQLGYGSKRAWGAAY